MSEALRKLIGETQSRFQAEPESAVMAFESDFAPAGGPALGGGAAGAPAGGGRAGGARRRRCRAQPGRADPRGARHLPGDHLPGVCHGARHPARQRRGQAHRHDRPQGVLRGRRQVRPGYQRISGTVQLQSSASDDGAREAARGGQRPLPGARHHHQPGAGELDLQVERSPTLAAE